MMTAPRWLVQLFEKMTHPTRDGVLFLAGLFGVMWETLYEDVDRPVLLAVFAAMMGLPVFLNFDEKAHLRNHDERITD
jgi:hypothetical protein